MLICHGCKNLKNMSNEELQKLQQTLSRLQDEVTQAQQQLNALLAVGDDTQQPAEHLETAVEPQPAPVTEVPPEEERIPIVGRIGMFDGVFMITDDQKKFQVSPNYISKSQLVVGDRLEIIDVDETGSKYSFKQTKKIQRKELQGILTKKDNQWAVHTDAGVFFVVAAAVRFNKADVGDTIAIDIPAEEVGVPVEWAAFKKILKQGIRETYEPKPKPYMQQKEQNDQALREEQEVSHEQKNTAAGTEIVKSRLTQPQVPAPEAQSPVPSQDDTLPQKKSPDMEALAGEVTVDTDNSKQQSGEISLQEEDLWELR